MEGSRLNQVVSILGPLLLALVKLWMRLFIIILTVTYILNSKWLQK